MADLAPGSMIAGYRIEGVAGRGGMGVVYRATQLALDRPAALKLIAAELAHDDGFRRRFERESRIAGSIDHPNVIPVYEAGEADGSLFLAMRWVEGTDLRQLLAAEGRLPPSRAVTIVSQVAAALDAAHRHGLVHRDVKPANVLVTQDEEEHVYLTDFGLTRRTTSTTALTQTGQFVGTIDYVAPEQIEGKAVDARADVYAVGCMLFHLLTGGVPYAKDSDVAKMFAHLHDPPPELPEDLGLESPAPAGGAQPGRAGEERTDALDATIRRSMSKDPSERQPSAGDLARAARAALAGATPAEPERNVATGAAAGGVETEPSAPEYGSTEPPQDTEPAATPSSATPPPAGPSAPPASPVGPPTGRGRPSPAALAGGLLAMAVLAVGAVLVLGGGDDDGPARQAAVVETIEVGGRPDGIAVDGDDVWVARSADGTLVRIGAGTGRVTGEPVQVGANPDSVAAADAVVWVTATDDDALSRVETSPSPAASPPIRVGRRPEGVSLGAQLVWVANSGEGTVSRIDRASPTVVGRPTRVGKNPVDVFVGRDDAWVTNSADDTVTRIDIASARVVGTPIPVGREPRGVAEGEGFVWVTNSGDGTVTRLDRRTGRPAGPPIRVGANPREVAVGAGSVWVANTGDGTLSRIDPSEGRVIGKPIKAGSEPIGVAVGAGSVWVASHRDGVVLRVRP